MADFKQAVKWMKEGEKVTRPQLIKEKVYAIIKCVDEIRYEDFDSREEGIIHQATNTVDVEADDWEVYNEEPEYYIFICPKCKKQLDVERLGKQCECGEWSYYETSKKKCVLCEVRECKNCSSTRVDKKNKCDECGYKDE